MEKSLITLFTMICAACLFFIFITINSMQNNQPELIIFKACLDKAETLTDDTICDCAEFVGHEEWCNGDVKY